MRPLKLGPDCWTFVTEDGSFPFHANENGLTPGLNGRKSEPGEPATWKTENAVKGALLFYRQFPEYRYYIFATSQEHATQIQTLRRVLTKTENET